ncbi:hypothetical protein FRB91_004186 [Serendipita sp. 411]|nr:hypothetical protein FRB91_004186 [Serendipita sp. 411]
MSTPRHLGRYRPDTEAIEDNRLNRGGGSRVSISIRDNTKPSRKRSNTWMFQDGRVKPRQSRIDHILNASRGPNSSRRKHRRSRDARNPAEHRNTTRSSIGEGTSARREKRHRLVQAKLPFDRLSEGSENLSGDSFELRKRNQHKSKSKPSASIHKHQRTTKSMPSGVTVTLRSTTEKPLELFDIFTPAATHSTTVTTSGRQVVRPQQTTSKRPPPNTSAHFARPSTEVVESRGNFEDPDSFVEISLRSALAFGMRRSREGFRLPETSWIGQGRILDLVNLLSQQTVPIQPYPCHIVGIRLDASLPVADFQLHIPTICDLLFENATKPSQPNDEGDSTLNDLTRFVCSYVSWSVTRAEDDTDQILLYIRSQLSMLMERVEEYCHLRGLSGLGFDRRLFGIHWFAVELSNRIALARVAIKGESMDEIVLKDATSDQFSVSLMARLLELGIRKTATAFSLGASSSSTIERYTLELWLALIHVTFLHPCNLDSQASASLTFWRLVMDSLDQSNRHFPSVIHEAEFIFSVIFFLSSISSISPLGVGRNERLLKAYWPIVCRALALLNLSPEVDERRKPSQATLAAKDTYLGMLFARCNVLVFRWNWSLQDNPGFKQLVEILRGALKNRKFMNLLHEQSEFPRFITQRNLDLLRQFDAKDSIQTILIKLIFQKVEDSQEGKQAARKWVSLLASTTTLEFTKEKPPTQKELSALFNQFTIKFILLHTNPDLNNIRTIINSSKKIVDFQSADQRSRQICIRAAMIFGRFCRHYTLPIQDVSIWISEMGHILLAEYNAARREGSAFQLKEITTMCALIVASLRDIFQSRAMDSDQTPLAATFPEASTCIFDVISKLLAAFREIDQCLSEVGLLLKCILDLRTHFFPDPPTPPFTREVNEEESQEDYGFDPINVNDLSLAEVMMLDGNEGSTRPYWDEDLDLAKGICELTNAITSAISRIAYLDDGVKKRKDVELWVEIWANVAILCTAHNLKQWDYFLHRTPVSLGRLGDLAWRQVAEPLFLLHVLSGDPKAYNVDREIFSKCWFLSMAADPQHIIPSYTFVLFHVDGLKSPLWEGIPFPRDMSEEEYEDVFAEQRQLLIESQ